MPVSKAAVIQYPSEDLQDKKVTPKFKKLATEGLELQLQIAALKKRQDAIKEALKKEYGDDQRYNVVVPEVGVITVVPKEELIVGDADRLKDIFGDNFENYVEIKTSYKAKAALEIIAEDEEKPLHDMVNEATAVKQTCALSFKPEKK